MKDKANAVLELVKLLYPKPEEETAESKPSNEEKLQIVVLPYGNVMVGKVTQQGEIVTISNGYAVRRWGTSAGLGQLANKGPRTETKLDKFYKTVTIHKLNVIFYLDCNITNWAHIV